MTSEMQLDLILEAINFATRKHQGQVRKDRRASPYITHPISVTRVLWQIGGIRDIQILSAAILHDTIEDTNTNEEEIQERFGENVLKVVLEVTDDKSLEKIERKRRQVAHAAELSQAAKLIKLGDKLINCRDILESPPKDWTLERRRDYIQWAADVVFEIRGTNAGLEEAFDQILHEAETQLGFTIKPFGTVNQRPWAPDSSMPTDRQD